MWDGRINKFTIGELIKTSREIGYPNNENLLEDLMIGLQDANYVGCRHLQIG